MLVTRLVTPRWFCNLFKVFPVVSMTQSLHLSNKPTLSPLLTKLALNSSLKKLEGLNKINLLSKLSPHSEVTPLPSPLIRIQLMTLLMVVVVIHVADTTIEVVALQVGAITIEDGAADVVVGTITTSTMSPLLLGIKHLSGLRHLHPFPLLLRNSPVYLDQDPLIDNNQAPHSPPNKPTTLPIHPLCTDPL